MDAPPEPALTAGVVARRLGIAPSTLRSWNRRYGIGPAGHEPGRYRRYTRHDVALLTAMKELIASGVLPADAADAVKKGVTAVLDPAATEAVPSAAPGHRTTGRLVRAAHHLDGHTAMRIVATCLAGHGVVPTWEQLCVPALRRVGEETARTSSCVDVEHLLSWSIQATLHAARPPAAPGTSPPVLLACASGEQHSLPMEALRAALSERGLPTHMLGADVPPTALRDAAARLRPWALVLWSHSPRTADMAALSTAGAFARTALAAGPGWERPSVSSLSHAVELITQR